MQDGCQIRRRLVISSEKRETTNTVRKKNGEKRGEKVAKTALSCRTCEKMPRVFIVVQPSALVYLFQQSDIQIGSFDEFKCHSLLDNPIILFLFGISSIIFCFYICIFVASL